MDPADVQMVTGNILRVADRMVTVVTVASITINLAVGFMAVGERAVVVAGRMS